MSPGISVIDSGQVDNISLIHSRMQSPDGPSRGLKCHAKIDSGATRYSKIEYERTPSMPGKRNHDRGTGSVSAQPYVHQTAREIQSYGTVSHLLPLGLEEPVRLEMTEQLNLLLADTMTLRDLYKKSHWQVAGAWYSNEHQC